MTHFLTRKTQFFTLLMLSRTSDNTTSQNIGGDQCMGGPPHLKFRGDRPPSPPLGLRPCLHTTDYVCAWIHTCWNIFKQLLNSKGDTGLPNIFLFVALTLKPKLVILF